MPKFKKGSKEAKAYMAKIRNMKKGSKIGAVKNKPATKKAKPKTTALHKDTKSHNVNIRVMSGNNLNGENLQLYSMQTISLNNIGIELNNLEKNINILSINKRQTKLAMDRKKIDEKIKVLKEQFKTLRSYLNSRARFV